MVSVVRQQDAAVTNQQQAAAATIPAEVKQIVFAVRAPGLDEHWYANFGHYAADFYYGFKNTTIYNLDEPNVVCEPPYAYSDYRFYNNKNHTKWVEGGRSFTFPRLGGKLCLYSLETKQITTLLDDPQGAVRDPIISYDARTILFSYCRKGDEHYHLYTVGIDGKGLKQLTFGDCDDIEPTFTPEEKIIFASSRANRYVQCWTTSVAILYTCNADGSDVRQLSANVEQDNTPWMLPDGRVLYTRWEYVDRSQVHYHHLWAANPDGTQQSVFYGNLTPGTVFVDAKPVPGSRKVIASLSWGHGDTEHAGAIGLIDPELGPDENSSVKKISQSSNYRDPWAFSEDAFIAAKGTQLIFMNGKGEEQTLLDLPQEWKARRLLLHEPRPVIARQPENILASTVYTDTEKGRFMLMDVYAGRNMAGVKKGEVKKLLILETLPKPINFTGGMEPMTYSGSFTLERIYGVVPVEEDGSAHFELPPLRSFFFVALDSNDLAIKRMQSFVSVMPGELTSCIGCHERRTETPAEIIARNPLAVRRKPSDITVIADYCGIDGDGCKMRASTGIPDVIDYPRDVQPVLNAHCIQCHRPEKRSGGVSLVGDRSPIYSISYYTITALGLVADGRNQARSNYPPRALGTGGSRLLKYIDGSHHDVHLTEREMAVVRLWIETGATYPGAYAALGSGMIGGYWQNRLDRSDLQWPEVQRMSKTIADNCAACHTGNSQLPLTATDEIGGPPWENFRNANDVRRKYSRQLLYNLTNPTLSTILLAHLSQKAGGYEAGGKTLFKNTKDPRYQVILSGVRRTAQALDSIKRFDMEGFIPRPEYIREMKKYGVLSPDEAPDKPRDVYALEQRYWQSLWYKPAVAATTTSPSLTDEERTALLEYIEGGSVVKKKH
jgi:cytochrome c553